MPYPLNPCNLHLTYAAEEPGLESRLFIVVKNFVEHIKNQILTFPGFPDQLPCSNDQDYSKNCAGNQNGNIKAMQTFCHCQISPKRRKYEQR